MNRIWVEGGSEEPNPGGQVTSARLRGRDRVKIELYCVMVPLSNGRGKIVWVQPVSNICIPPLVVQARHMLDSHTSRPSLIFKGYMWANFKHFM